jgi:hypothetical protein
MVKKQATDLLMAVQRFRWNLRFEKHRPGETPGQSAPVVR